MNKLPFEKIEREVLVRQDSETDLRYGGVPEQRSVEKLIEFGIVNIDKPDGPTSHEVSAFVKRILHIDRAGHSGTLE
jgi:H/ACA ribonucleoprotein complex subunit 4